MAYVSKLTVTDSTKTNTANVSVDSKLSVADEEIIGLLKQMLDMQKLIYNRLTAISGEGASYFDIMEIE